MMCDVFNTWTNSIRCVNYIYSKYPLKKNQYKRDHLERNTSRIFQKLGLPGRYENTITK